MLVCVCFGGLIDWLVQVNEFLCKSQVQPLKGKPHPHLKILVSLTRMEWIQSLHGSNFQKLFQWTTQEYQWRVANDPFQQWSSCKDVVENLHDVVLQGFPMFLEVGLRIYLIYPSIVHGKGVVIFFFRHHGDQRGEILLNHLTQKPTLATFVWVVEVTLVDSCPCKLVLYD